MRPFFFTPPPFARHRPLRGLECCRHLPFQALRAEGEAGRVVCSRGWRLPLFTLRCVAVSQG